MDFDPTVKEVINDLSTYLCSCGLKGISLLTGISEQDIKKLSEKSFEDLYHSGNGRRLLFWWFQLPSKGGDMRPFVPTELKEEDFRDGLYKGDQLLSCRLPVQLDQLIEDFRKKFISGRSK